MKKILQTLSVLFCILYTSAFVHAKSIIDIQNKRNAPFNNKGLSFAMESSVLSSMKIGWSTHNSATFGEVIKKNKVVKKDFLLDTKEEKRIKSNAYINTKNNSINTVKGANKALIIIDTPHAGDINSNNGDSYIIESSVLGNMNVGGPGGSISIRGGGQILQTLTMSGNAFLNIEEGGRIGDGLRITGGNSVTTILGIVNNGIIFGNGTNELTVSGLFSQIGSIIGSTNSIVGGTGVETVLLESTTINSAINLGSGNNVLTLDSSNTSILFSGTGVDTFIIKGGSSVAGNIETGGGGDSLRIFDSIITGSILTQASGAVGNDTIKIVATTISGSIETGGGIDTLNLEENTFITGNITSLDSLNLFSTFSSGLSGNISVTNALKLQATTGIIVEGTVQSGANSIYFVEDSTFLQEIRFNGTTTFTAIDSILRGQMHAGAGVVTISLTGGSVESINASQNSILTDITLNNITISNMIFGSGQNTLNTNSAIVNAFTANNNIRIVSTNSTFTTTIVSGGELIGSFHDSILENGISTSVGNFVNTIELYNTTSTGAINLGGTVNINSTNSTFLDINTNARNDKIKLTNSTVENILSQGGNDTVSIYGGRANSVQLGAGDDVLLAVNTTITNISTAGGINNIILDGSTFGSLTTEVGGTDRNALNIKNHSKYTGEVLEMATGSILIDGKLSFINPEGIINNGTIINTNALDINQDGILDANKYSLGTTLKINSQTMNNFSNTPITQLYADIRIGSVTKLDISTVTNYAGKPYIIVFKNINGLEGLVQDRIENVIISNASIVPVLYKKYNILGGYLYSLEENQVTLNNYDLVNRGISPTNYGYAAAHTAIRSYNTTLWRGLLSHFQEELQMARKNDGRKKDPGHIASGVSVWAKANYSLSRLSPFDAPILNENIISGLMGVDFANIAIAKNTSLMFQVFGGLGYVWSDFKNISEFDITFNTNQMNITLGGSIGFEYLTQENLGKVFVNLIGWYTHATSIIDSSLFIKEDTWDNGSINGALSFGYSVYLKGTIITPQIDVVYFNTFSKNYFSEDSGMVTLTKDERVLGRASILLGQDTGIGLTPYIKAGIEVPLYVGTNSGLAKIDNSIEEYSYTTNSFSTDVGLGLAYRGGFNHFKISVSVETNLFLGAKEGLDTALQLGLNF